MKNSLSGKIRERYIRRKRWKIAVTLLACMVVLGTVYAIILPARTMTGQTFCGKESHTHTGECYESRLACGQEEAEGHTHTEACYESYLACEQGETEGHEHDGECYQDRLICGLEETEGHKHTEACYEKTLVCQLVEHEHTLSCYSDPETDVEDSSVWERTLPQNLGDDRAENLIAVAKSQLGYTESQNNYDVDDNNNIHGYTRYGAWYGNSYGEWNAMFASFCLSYAGVPESEIPYSSESRSWIGELQSAGLYQSAADYDAIPGNLVFLDRDGDSEADAVGIVTKAENDSVEIIAGDVDDKVDTLSYAAGSGSILGYGVVVQNTEEQEKNTNDAAGISVADDAGLQLAAATDDVEDIKLGETKTLSIGAGETVKLRFVPEYSHEYIFYSTGSSDPDPFGHLYDSNGNEIASNDDGAGNRQFKIAYYLEAGKTYFCGARWLNSSAAGELPVMLKLGEHEYSMDDSGQLVCICGDTRSVSGSCGDSLTWSFDVETGILSINGSGDMTDYTSTGNTPWAAFSRQIKSVNIGEGVTSVGDYAFYNYTGLTTVSFPSSLTDAGAYSFSGCSALETADLSKTGVTSIRDFAFKDCTGLKTVSFPKTLTGIATRAFCNNSALKQVDLADTQVASIGYGAFYSCQSMESISFPNTLTSLGEYAFNQCKSLTEMQMAETKLTSISRGAISTCSALKKVTLPKTLTQIESSAFGSCSSLTDINLEDTAVTYIGSEAFRGCSKLRNISLPDSVSYLGSSAFYECRSLAEIDLSKIQITGINGSTFSGCSALKRIIYPAALVSLGDYSFKDCTGLTEFSIPSTVTSVGWHILDGSYEVTEVRMEASEIKSFSTAQSETGSDFHVSIGSSVGNLSANTVTGLTKMGCTGISFEGAGYLTLEGWQVDSLPERLNVVPKGRYYADYQGVLYRVDETAGTASVFYCPSNLTSYEVLKELPASEDGKTIPVVGVDSLAFSDASGLTTLNFAAPEQITTLNTQAFSRARLLESINGKETADEVLKSFTSTELAAGAMLFLQTKITDSSSTLAKDAMIIEKENLKLTISTQKGDNRTPSQSEKGTYLYYTGEAVQTTVTVSNADSSAVDNGTVIRVYYQFDSENGKLNYKPGSYKVTSTSGKEYTMKVVQTASDNCYYVELARPDQGDTISILLTSSYPSPTSEGGSAMLWGDVLTQTEKETLGDDGVLPVEKYQEMNWTTEADTFPIEKTQGNQPELKGDGSGSAYISGLSYRIGMARSDTTLEGIGKDYMKSAEFEDVLTLPEGVTLAEDVTESIADGTVHITYVSGGGFYFYTAGGRCFLQLGVSNPYVNYKYLQNGKVYLNDEGNLVVSWRFINSNLATEMDNLTFTYKVNDQTLVIKDPKESVTYQMDNRVTAVQHFMYSEDQVQQDSCSATVKQASSSLELAKNLTNYSGSYFGEAMTYRITASNPGALPYQRLAFLTDDLPTQLYMDAGNIAATFAEDAGKQLTLTIKNVTRCTTKTGESIKGIDGTNGTTSLHNTGTGTSYSGTSGTDPDQEGKSRIVISWQDDNSLLFTVDDGSSYYCEASETGIQALLQQLGVLVTSDTQYCLKWDLRDADGSVVNLPGGGKTEKKVYCTRKDTFMLLNSDTSYQYPQAGYWCYNSVYAKDASDSTLKNYSCATYNSREFSLSKNWNRNGETIDDETVLRQGDVLTYTLGVQHSGSAQYEALPLVDHMTGTQALLVPVGKNEGADWTKGLDTVTEEGVDYYILRQAGTYRNVWTSNNQMADSVVVTASDSGLDTLIKWYFVNYTGNRTDNVTYHSYVCPDVTGQDTLNFSLNNESWLSDHQSHRLYATLNGWHGTTFDFDKEIVDTPTDSTAGYRHSTVSEGQSVYYRLSLTSSRDADGTDRSTTITGTDMKDVLPASIAAAPWSRSNIEITYDTANGKVTNGDAWDVAGTAGNEKNPQYIQWSDNFSINFTGTAYIYVKLTFPAGDAWKEYGAEYGSEVLTNSFYVLNAQRSVNHELAIEGQVRLQKGVYDTGYFYYKNDNPSYYLSDLAIEDGRLYYQNNDSKVRAVRYYVTLYNAGSARLYLTEMQDILPRGFTYVGSASFSTYSYSTGNTVMDEKGSWAIKRYANVRVTTATDVSGHQHAAFSFSKYDGSSGVSYDEDRKLCYLEPGQYVDFTYICKTNKTADTDEAAVNIVTMPYYDYTNGGVRIDDGYSLTAYQSNKYTPNDGGCDVLDNTEAENLGATGMTSDTKWLTSRVTLTRGSIRPGITKTLISTTDQNGTTTLKPNSAHNKDILNWSILTENDGTSSITDYVLTDSMQSPYMFTGKVSYEIYRSSASDSSSLIAKPDNDYLFTVEQGTADDEWKITTNKNVSSTLKLGGDPIALKCAWYYSLRQNYSKDFYKDVEVWVSIVKDANGNGVLSLRFPDETMGIPEGGQSELKLSTYNTSDSLVNKVFVNTSFITPLSQTWDNTTNKGNVTSLATPYSENESASVRNSAPITVAYGYVTGASKSVKEQENNSNTAKCTDDTNYIVLQDSSRLFRYDLTVENSTPLAMEKLVMIDGLPEVDDHTAFLTDDPRFSEFKVSLADDPEFTVTVKDKDGSSTELDSSQYTIEYSTATDFTGEDWSGSSSWSSNKTGARAVRLIILDPTDTLIPAKSEITLSMTCKIDDTNVQPGQVAWNSFGYHYRLQGQVAELESAPLKVGVKTPSVPKLRKQVVDYNGLPRTVDSDTSFEFLVYQGAALSGTYATEADLITALGDTPYEKFTVTVKSGESLSESVSLQTEKLNWTKGQKYTIAELPVSEDFAFKRFLNSASDTCTVTYDPEQNQVITCENTNLRWNATVKKENTSHEALEGAVFALYSPNSADQLPAVPADYEGKAALTLEYNSRTWYLKGIGATPESGELTWSNLLGDEYYLLEIQAPAGYHLNSPAGLMIRRENESHGICTVTVVNRAGYSLPESGGSGTFWYTLGGILLCGAAALMYYLGKRRKGVKRPPDAHDLTV